MKQSLASAGSFIKLFHPANDHYGLSPIEVAATAIDIHNAAARWNKALLDNAARPSGALVYTRGGQLTSEQFTRLKSELEQSFQGPAMPVGRYCSKVVSTGKPCRSHHATWTSSN